MPRRLIRLDTGIRQTVEYPAKYSARQSSPIFNVNYQTAVTKEAKFPFQTFKIPVVFSFRPILFFTKQNCELISKFCAVTGNNKSDIWSFSVPVSAVSG
jgi:hypothetical protein